MKKIAILVLLSSLITATSFAQNNNRSDERIKAMRVAFITERLELTPEEAQQFWPVYNQYEAKKKSLRKSHKTKMRNGKSIEESSESEVEAMIAAHLDYEEQQLALNKQLVADLRDVISAKKIAKLMRAEKAFKEKIVDLLGKRGQRGDGQRERN